MFETSDGNAALISAYAAGEEDNSCIKDSQGKVYDNFGKGNYVHNNTIKDFGYAPGGAFAKPGSEGGLKDFTDAFMAGYKNFPAVMWDGVVDPNPAVSAGVDVSTGYPLGGNYTGHYGKDAATITLVPGAESHSILRGVTVAELVGHGGLYKNTPLQNGTTPLLMGTLPGTATEPVAWTHRYGEKKARIFYTSLGHWDDFELPAFRRFLLNGIAWALEK